MTIVETGADAPRLTQPHAPGVITGGVDTHLDTHMAAAVDANGAVLGVAQFDATAAGYEALHAWLAGHGPLGRVGVEGTGAYGAGLARHLRSRQVELVEVDRPDRQARRRNGKSDPLDAVTAARAALSGRATGVPKSADGHVEAIRALLVARRSARSARIGVLGQLRCLLVTAPDDVRAQFRGVSTAKLLAAAEALDTTGHGPAPVGTGRRKAKDANAICLAASRAAAKGTIPQRAGGDGEVVRATTGFVLGSLARRARQLDADLADIDERLCVHVSAAAPSLLALHCVGVRSAAILLAAAGDNGGRVRSEAAFAKICGVAPLEASSGKRTRHRLNRGGNRQANHALWRIALARMSHDDRTRAYVERKTTEGKTKAEILRQLKRYIAREIYPHLPNSD